MEIPTQLDANLGFDLSNLRSGSFDFAASVPSSMSPNQPMHMNNYIDVSMGTDGSLSANQTAVSHGQGGFQCSVCFKVKNTKNDLK